MAEGRRADIGIVGLAVMGQNLALNILEHGFVTCIYNRTSDKTKEFLNAEGKGKDFMVAYTLKNLVDSLKVPRIVMLLVKAGTAVDEVLSKLVSLLEPGDVIIDGGNSEYIDSTRREKKLKAKQLLYVGSGVSGGEKGARHGPSLMPGGNIEAWPLIKNIFQSISAQADGAPCCEWVGPEGAGHFVKMVHNGIEYGDMQLISEAYHIMKQVLKLNNDAIGEIFEQWNRTELESYLVEITAEILKFHDEDDQSLLDKIVDKAGQKGTGKWTTLSSLEYGIPLTLVGEAVFARCLSELKEERMLASKCLKGPDNLTSNYPTCSKEEFVEDIRKALYASKIISYSQGFMLMRNTNCAFGWKLNLGGIATIWKGGCIIRSKFLGDIKRAFDREPNLVNLLFNEFFTEAVHSCQESWRRVISYSVLLGIPVPAFSTALAFFDGYRSSWLPANLIQAQRDYFGAHTYKRSDHPDEPVHTDWTKSPSKQSPAPAAQP
ncbi:hypothetical protein HELRODRAFT_187587 [Helobdella robusta]|uniref:6-phosphogluconate dehydrogenase, decarboxylating n=1 Tax=Helobdella robusta TaxID=6412 RepID=T1FPA9_HELRO|nr:hypothetical protein HELRODRAFT_187587 [Helobdella robusta]ESN92116.1 hypothetical protein HELRODRAFT_187587 [Helobdella robusta]